MPELTLTQPGQLWWLLLLPVLVWLSLPPRPRRVAYTAHLPQWRDAARSLRRRPPRALSLKTALLLLAAAAAVFAAVGLAVAGRPGPTPLVVLLDGSASMAANGAFDRAREALRRQFAALPGTVDVRVLRCGGGLVRRHGASARALHDLGVPAGARTVDFAPLADGLADPDTVVWTLTDGQGAGALPAASALSLFGAPAVNAAVLAVRVVDHWPLPELELEADVVGFGPSPLAARVVVAGAVEPVAPRDLTLAPGAIETLSWPVRRTAAGGRLEVAIALPGDALPADDRWRAQLPPLPAPRIAVLADPEAGPFAAVAAEALAAEVQGSVVTPQAGVEIGLVLVEGGEVGLAPGRARALCFGARHAGGPAPGDGRPVGALDWDRGSPLTAGLDLAELRVEVAFPPTLPVGEPFLFGEIAGQRAPLAVVARGDEAASVHFAFRLQDSNLALLAAFPQLLRRAFVQSYGRAAELVVESAPPPPGEQDLWQRQVAADRALPPFGAPDRSLGSWLMIVAAAAVLLRALLR